ncbi:MAG: 3-hydroxyacyl-CoA dehydrogenase family protein [Clostridiaceae bacterium]|nr:3-hydroxyacyl-CoA dehydrogenase family protein [Clostridiaceae bacterium]
MKLGVIGSGTMGYGIAQTAAQNGCEVLLYDIVQEQLDKAKNSIAGSLKGRVAKGKISQEEMNSVIGNITASTDIQKLADREIIIEAIIEKVELKQSVFSQIENIVSEDTLLATNTSSLSIIEIAQALNDPSRLVGIHFFNPAPVMKLVEIVRSLVVREDVVERAKQFSASLGKEVILAKDTPGFIVNYLQYPFRLNAIRMLERGMATKEDIDKAAKLGLGQPMGPFELQDLVGLDVTYSAVKAIYEETKDPAMAPPILLKRMVEAGLLGRKTGKGFYEYPNK